MPLFTKHYSTIYSRDGSEITPDIYELEAQVEGFSNPTGKANRRTLTYVVTRTDDGVKRFTREGLFG